MLDLEEKEKKLKREIEKGGSFFKHRRGGDIYLLNQKLEEVIYGSFCTSIVMLTTKNNATANIEEKCKKRFSEIDFSCKFFSDQSFEGAS